MRIRFLQTYIDWRIIAARHLSTTADRDKPQPLEFGRNGIVCQDICLAYHCARRR
jgi:hypothetical protein